MILLRGGPQGTTAFFQYDRAERGCQVLDPDFTATANGVEAETFRGGPSFGPCDSPLVDFAPPPSPADGMILEMSSGEDRVIVGIDELGQTIDGQLLAGRAHLKINWSNLPAIIRCGGADDCQWLGQQPVLVALDVAFDVSP